MWQVAPQPRPVQTRENRWCSGPHRPCKHLTRFGHPRELRKCRECANAKIPGGGSHLGIQTTRGPKAEFSPCRHGSKSSKQNCRKCKLEGLPGGGTRLCAAHNKRLSRCTECGPDKVACAQTSNSPRREMLGSPRPRHWRHCSSHPRRGLSAHAGEESTSRHLYPRTSAGYVSCTCIHTCIHTYIHTYMYACIHTYILCLSVSESMPNILCE